MIAQKATEKEWNTALREISTAELREATLALGLKLAPVDLSWETFCAQFHSALERFQEANIDITTFVLMKDMLEQTKKEVHSLRHFAYLGLTQLLQYREEEDYTAFQKRQKKSKQRRADIHPEKPEKD